MAICRASATHRVPDRVYGHEPRTGDTAVIADGFDKPNGLVFSPDERTLYVGDSGAIHAPGDYDAERPHHVVAFDVADGRRLADQRLFAIVEPGFPDGMTVDAAGRLYVSGRGARGVGRRARRNGERLTRGARSFGPTERRHVGVLTCRPRRKSALRGRQRSL